MVMKEKVKVLLADDHAMVTKLIRTYFEIYPNVMIAGETGTAKGTLEYLAGSQPDVVFLDIDFPDKDGLEVLKEIKHSYPGLRVIMLTNHDEGWIIKKSVSLGCNGYISKTADADELMEAIETVMGGGTYFCKSSFASFMKSMASGNGHEAKAKGLSIGEEDEEKAEPLTTPSAKWMSISKREKQILKLIKEGYSTKQISMELFIAVRTVETHRKNMMSKLGVNSTLNLIKIAHESTLVS
jgi:two-component system nitrate/nitrite response regulator NarL